MRSLTGLVAVLVALVAAAPAHATFPGRNGGIAYAQLTTSHDLDGMITERARLLVALPPFGSSGGGRWSTAGPTARSRLLGALVLAGRGADRLRRRRAPRLIDADGGEAVLLPAATANDGDPCFSHDGKRIAFTGVNDRGGTDLYTRRLEGGASAPDHPRRRRARLVVARPARVCAQRKRVQRATRTAAIAAG